MDPAKIYQAHVSRKSLLSVDFFADGEGFVTGGEDAHVYAYIPNAKGGFTCNVYQCGAEAISAVAVEHGNNYIFACDKAGKIYRIHREASKNKIRGGKFIVENADVANVNCTINSIEFSLDGKLCIVSSNAKHAKIYDFDLKRSSIKYKTSLQKHNSHCSGASFSPDGSACVSVGDDKAILVHNIVDKSSRFFRPYEARPRCCHFHQGGILVGVGYDDGTFLVQDITTGQVIQFYRKVHKDSIESIQFHPSGHFCLTASLDKTICIWDLVEGQLFYTIQGESAIRDACWNLSGSMFMTCNDGGFINVYQTNFDKLIRTVENETRVINGTSSKPLDDALGILPHRKGIMNEPQPTNPYRLESRKKYDSMAEEDKYKFIDASLQKIMQSMDFLTKSASMIQQRVDAQQETLQRLRAKHNGQSL